MVMMMFRRAAIFALAIALLVPEATPVQAAPGQPVPVVQVGLVVQLITPEVLSVHVSYTCQPSPTTEAFIEVTVTQSSPSPASALGDAPITCDGAGHQIDVAVAGGPAFAPGAALALAQACTGLICGSDARKVVIQ